LYTLGQFGNGALADRLGARWIVGAGLLTAASANVGMGFVVSLGGLALLNCVNGASQATGWPGLVKNMSAWFRARERGVLMAWWSTNYVAGGYLATIFATWCATDAPFYRELGWRRGFWGPALVLALVGVAFLAFACNRPADAGLPEIEDEDE